MDINAKHCLASLIVFFSLSFFCSSFFLHLTSSSQFLLSSFFFLFFFLSPEPPPHSSLFLSFFFPLFFFSITFSLRLLYLFFFFSLSFSQPAALEFSLTAEAVAVERSIDPSFFFLRLWIPCNCDYGLCLGMVVASCAVYGGVLLKILSFFFFFFSFVVVFGFGICWRIQ